MIALIQKRIVLNLINIMYMVFRNTVGSQVKKIYLMKSIKGGQSPVESTPKMVS